MGVLVAPLEALTDPEITDPERRVLLTLYSFKNKASDTVWPSLNAIAERANLRDATRVSKLTKSLSKKGWLTKEKRKFGGSNDYVLTVPERLSILDEDAMLDSQSNFDSDTNSILDSETNSILDSAAKSIEQTSEQTKEQTSEPCEFFCEAKTKSERFEVFWKFWPGDFGAKGSKVEAAAAWERIPIAKHAEIVAALRAQIEHKHRQREAGEFEPNFQHVCRWLRKERWTDEIPEPKPAPKLELV